MDAVETYLKTHLEPILADLTRKAEVASRGWFSIQHAAEYADLSPDHIRRAIRGGMLPASNVGTSDRPTYRISRQDLDQWLEKRKTGALPPPRKKSNKPIALPPSSHF